MKYKLNYFIIPVIVFGVLFVSSYFTQGNMGWYDMLILPNLTPRKEVFPIVWNLLGALTALSLVLFYNNSTNDSNVKTVLSLFMLNGFLVAGWMVAFFNYHKIPVALFIAIALVITVIHLICIMYKKNRLAALLLIPYALWSSFAVYLNWHIWLLN